MDEQAANNHYAGDKSPPLHIGWLALLTLFLILACGVAAAAEKLIAFDVPEGDAEETLAKWSRQADVQILWDFTRAKGFRTQEVKGRFEARDALRRMLVGTPFDFAFVNESTVAITFEPRNPHPTSPYTAGPPSLANVRLDVVQIIAKALDDRVPPPEVETLTFSRADIDRSGAATLQGFLGTLPQIFGGGPTEDTQVGREARTNDAHGSGVNVRGMDAGATVVLLDGQRLAPSGTDAGWVDISLVPLGVIERLHLLPNAATAEYGSDALGGVVDLRLRSSFTGSETTARLGSVTDGALQEHDYNQLLGTRWSDGNGVLALEYYSRDALPASARWQATSDLTPFGGSNFDLMGGNPGTIVGAGTTWAIPHAQDGRSLSPANLVAGTRNLSSQWQGATVLPEERRLSALAIARQVVGSDTTLFADLLLADRNIESHAAGYETTLLVPPSNPYYVNPSGVPGRVSVLYGFGTDLGPLTTTAEERAGNFQVGASWQATQRWQVRSALGYSFEHDAQLIRGYANPAVLATALADSNPDTAFNPFGDGSYTNPATLNAIRAQTHFDSTSALLLASLRAEGALASLSTGDLSLRTGLDFRDQRFDADAEPIPPTPALRSVLGRHVVGGFAQLRIPLLGSPDPQAQTPRLQFSAALRGDHYSDVGGALTPQLGLLWSPLRSLALRSTWTRALRPPNLPDRVETENQSGVVLLPDTASPTGSTAALVWTGNNADLKAERAMNWTLGADFTPEGAPSLTLSLTYFNTVVKDRIEETPFELNALEDPADRAVVIRAPTDAERTAPCARSTFHGLAFTCLTAPIGALVDLRLRNAASVATRGIDLNAEYTVHRLAGELKTGIMATYLFAYTQQERSGGPILDLLNTPHNPLDLRLRGSLSWTRGPFSLATYLNYSNHYHDPLSDPAREVASWTTVDAYLSFHFGGRDGIELAVNAENLFNRAPPFVNNPVGIGYDQENADLLGRFISVDLKKRW